MAQVTPNILRCMSPENRARFAGGGGGVGAKAGLVARVASRRGGARRQPNGTERAFLSWYKPAYNGEKLHYETMTFRLPGGSRYTPDFIENYNGNIICHEVKGCHRLGSHGRALTAFREARAAFPFVKFYWFERQGDGSFVEKYQYGEGKTA